MYIYIYLYSLLKTVPVSFTLMQSHPKFNLNNNNKARVCPQLSNYKKNIKNIKNMRALWMQDSREKNTCTKGSDLFTVPTQAWNITVSRPCPASSTFSITCHCTSMADVTSLRPPRVILTRTPRPNLSMTSASFIL